MNVEKSEAHGRPEWATSGHSGVVGLWQVAQGSRAGFPGHFLMSYVTLRQHVRGRCFCSHEAGLRAVINRDTRSRGVFACHNQSSDDRVASASAFLVFRTEALTNRNGQACELSHQQGNS